MKLISLCIIVSLILASCATSKSSGRVNVLSGKSTVEGSGTQIKAPPATPGEKVPARPMLTMNKPLDIDRENFVSYASRFLNVPYVYASSDPAKGFDCSGFLYYVFLQFNVKAPRSSYNYETVGKNVTIEKALPGDLVLFTTPSDSTKIGHIGIVTETAPKLSFIHASTSRGVIISPLSGYWQKYFVKVIRVLK